MKIEFSSEGNAIRNLTGGSLLLKIFMIGFLTLVLLIPSAFVMELISERQKRQEEAFSEISDKWSGKQLVGGPVMVIPYSQPTKTGNATSNGEEESSEQTFVYILPDSLEIVARSKTETRKRGIYEAAVYQAGIHVEGRFSELDAKKAGIDPALLKWDKARVVVGLEDLKGLKNNPVIALDGNNFEVEPDFSGLHLFSNNLVVQVDLSEKRQAGLPFSFDLDIRGSQELQFLHLGKNTSVKITGDWGNPSFSGRYLPDDRSVGQDSFSASWVLPYFNRPFPQQWLGENVHLSKGMKEQNGKADSHAAAEGAFGVSFKMPVDQYQKVNRTAKYAVLVILLTFIALYSTELITRRKIHFLHYILIGVAMVVYYTLLLAFSEHTGFDAAYLIASLATVGLIGFFIYALIRSGKTALVMSSVLGVFYVFVYCIIQLQEMALLAGSVGLFVIVAILMFLAQKMNLSA